MPNFDSSWGGTMNSILLADDETVICTEFARTLVDFGYRVETVSTLESAVRTAKRRQFDAILVEFNLRSERSAHPRAGNGLRLIQKLRTAQFIVPILIFTVMEGDLYKRASLDAGADGFILKATSIPSMVSSLRGHIRRLGRNVRKKAPLNSDRRVTNPMPGKGESPLRTDACRVRTGLNPG
jgi:DNA-binding response OmpR family regulator